MTPTTTPTTTRTTARPGRMAPADLARTAAVGLRTRRLRAALSALGIAIGVASIVAVLGLSASSQAGLLAEIDRLGTNMLTVAPGVDIEGEEVELPATAPAMVARIGAVERVQTTGETGAKVYRSPLVPEINSNGLTVRAASLGLPETVRTRVAEGVFLNAATATRPTAVLGHDAARRLGFDRVRPGQRIWVGGQWFYVAGILARADLAPEIDASVLIGYPAARKYLRHDGHPTTVYVRCDTARVNAVHAVLARTVNPMSPGDVTVGNPSDALVARAAAESALNGLFLGLGAVALLVGGVGVANTMIISVLERRSEIGLRRALGATRGHIRVQFFAEAVLLAGIGGAVGVLCGVAATAGYAAVKGWAVVLPLEAWAGGVGAAIAIGAVAGLPPAIRAARMPPTEALRAS
ncbi:ABC transporter permease [Actinomadura algeriensis]|uniref:ABC transport system permease protein n=1 Tax=Actinomadura algeriensis TaxID=1679523 RepID=A0ABR9JIV0_9ACTN|nr:ABC transporter permease [Actinomadura algeriensis]MBE1530479.1 putative ABC transport system permease protein [Actinomadura algeriensis]